MKIPMTKTIGVFFRFLERSRIPPMSSLCFKDEWANGHILVPSGLHSVQREPAGDNIPQFSRTVAEVGRCYPDIVKFFLSCIIYMRCITTTRLYTCYIIHELDKDKTIDVIS